MCLFPYRRRGFLEQVAEKGNLPSIFSYAPAEKKVRQTSTDRASRRIKWEVSFIIVTKVTLYRRNWLHDENKIFLHLLIIYKIKREQTLS